MMRLAIGLQNFGEIRNRNICYVDKTAYLSRLIASGKFLFLAPSKTFWQVFDAFDLEGFV